MSAWLNFSKDTQQPVGDTMADAKQNKTVAATARPTTTELLGVGFQRAGSGALETKPSSTAGNRKPSLSIFRINAGSGTSNAPPRPMVPSKPSTTGSDNPSGGSGDK